MVDNDMNIFNQLIQVEKMYNTFIVSRKKRKTTQTPHLILLCVNLSEMFM